MRLHRLEIEGFGPFRRLQTIDFDAFADDGLFLISGRTGAGKSSILDAVCFALYGSIPRFTSGEKRLRSDHSEPEEPTQVALEFSTGGTRYRVVRSPAYDRMRRDGKGMTTQAPAVELSAWENGQWVGRSARAVDVGHDLGEILQLTKDQFLQVILLAQGRFARFLLAKNDERQAVLRTLFGTRRFEDYAEELNERRKASAAALEADHRALDAELDEAEEAITAAGLAGDDEAPPGRSVEERRSLLAGALPRAQYRVETTQAAVAAAQQDVQRAADELARESERAQSQRKRDDARRAVEAVDEAAPQIAALRAELQDADDAESLRGALDARERARTADEAAQRETERTAKQWAAAADQDAAIADAASLRERAAEAERTLGVLESVLRTEADLPALADAVETAQVHVAAAAQASSELRARADALPGLIEALGGELAVLAVASAGLDEHVRALTQREAERLGAQRWEAARTQAVRAEEEREAAETAWAQSRRTVTELVRRRMAGFAGELAAELVPGEPCTVCGSTAHPAPAVRADEPVTEDDILAAEAAREVLAAQAEETERAARQSREAVAAAATESGGRSVAEADAAVTAARAAVDAARMAAQRQEELRARHDEHVAERDVLVERQGAAAAAQALAQEALTLAAERHRRSTDAVTEHRGGHASVADRVSAVRQRRDAAQAHATALEAAAAAAHALAEAQSAVETALGATPFATETAAAGALRSGVQREQMRTEIQAHEIERERSRALLLQYELEMLPEEPIELAPLRERSAAVLARAAAAERERADAEHVGARLRRAVERIEDAWRAISAAVREHEVITRLADTVNGREPNTMKMALETFVLAAELEDIVTAANVRLSDMSSGRYRLAHTDERQAHGAASGLGIEVHDAHTGRARPASSLSGGETFLASLALALGLAEVVTARAGGIHLDTLFIDEGFGSLDAETLDIAMHTLDELRAGGRTVGIISHVEAMQDQIPARLQVNVDPDGSSSVSLGLR